MKTNYKIYREKHKSLKNRMRFLVNISILIAVFMFSSIFIYVINQGVQHMEGELSSYYIEQIQGIVIESTKRGPKVTSSDDVNIVEDSKSGFVKDRVFIGQMEKLMDLIPIFSISIVVDEEEVYYTDAQELLNNIFQRNQEIMELSDQEINELQLMKADKLSFKGESLVATLYDASEKAIGTVEVGIDSRIELAIYSLIMVSIILIGILVTIIMRILTTMITRPILSPIEQLQKQMEKLADESYEDVNPTVVVNKRTVKEIRDLSLVMNKLLNKMINFNEVITQAEKMASVGQLTAAITHEINTPLGVINANAGLLKMLAEEAVNAETKEDKEMLLETMGQAAETSEEACQRIQVIIKSLRSYSRIDQADFMPACINDSMRSVVTLTTNLHKNRIEIIEDFDQIPEVSCYIGLMNQVFMNLIINAIQSIDQEGTITLKTRSDDKYVYASVIDTGCGIDPKNLYRIFEYGFTTKQPGSGSGIGLALSNNIIRKHNGEILVDSLLGQGTTITVKIPIEQET